MFEHVGVGHYDVFFRKCAELLADDGVMLLHSIGRSEGPGITNPWIAKYIFPGGYIPALSEVLPAVERAGFLVTDIEILRLHYAETLKHWRERFLAHREDLEKIYDERFVRMWEFYLAASEMTFREQGMMVFQIQLTKRQGVVPITRDYIAREEARLARRWRAAAARRCGSPASRTFFRRARTQIRQAHICEIDCKMRVAVRIGDSGTSSDLSIAIAADAMLRRKSGLAHECVHQHGWRANRA